MYDLDATTQHKAMKAIPIQAQYTKKKRTKKHEDVASLKPFHILIQEEIE